MKMLKRVGIFPVDQESITLFENIHECRYGEIMHIASIKAWGLCGKKIQRCDGSEIIIEEGIGNIIKECEVLILLESWHDASPEYIKSVVKTAKQKSITIVSINNIRNSLEIDQHYENVVVAKKLKIQKKCDDLRVRKINIPVICVLGLTQNSGKLKKNIRYFNNCLNYFVDTYKDIFSKKTALFVLFFYQLTTWQRNILCIIVYGRFTLGHFNISHQFLIASLNFNFHHGTWCL